jgi:choice-of-anchor B domain-containing protein
MKTFTLAVALLFSSVVLNAQNFNISLMSNMPYPNDDLANIGGWTSPSGTEYALVGTTSGLSIVDVSNPSNPVEVVLVPGPNSIWREVKTYDHYAYVTTEGGGGLQIVDLSQLPGAAPAVNWTGNGAINGQLNSIHSLHIEDGYVYLHGSNLFQGATVIADIATNPLSPNYVGHTPGAYVHDGYVRGNYFYACHIYNGDFTVYDISNKANPIPVGMKVTPGNFTHNSWLSTNSQYLFTTDEVSDSYLTAYDVSNPANITELDRIQITPGSGSIVHNTHIIQKNGGDFAVTSWYKDGVVITDVSRPDNMINVGWYDTYTQGAGDGFNGDWGVYPYLPSGILVVSDIDNGLFVLEPSYQRACYLEGVVTDSVTGAPIFNATVQILNTNISKKSKANGEYKTGTVNTGTYDIQVSAAGYFTKVITGVSLTSGNVTIQNVALAPLASTALGGQVIESGSNNPIPNADVTFTANGLQYSATADASGNFTIPSMVIGTYDITVGHWGHRTYCSTVGVAANPSPLVITLDKGYYDDFSFDFGWTFSGTSPNHWERGVPHGTPAVFGPGYANPNEDDQTDCLDQAYVTDNNPNASSSGSNDVDNGTAILTSPVFDLTGFPNPVLKYTCWFYNAGGNGNPNDSLIIRISNGATTVTLETATANTPGMGTWVDQSYSLIGLIPITANMSLTVYTADQPNTGHVVEAGFDKFEVQWATGINQISNEIISLTASPNPFTDVLKINYHSPSSSPCNIVVTDITGRVVEKSGILPVSGTLLLGNDYSSGVYFVQLFESGKFVKSIKVVKQQVTH